jgi:cbb3-type cytochrome oxidase maturation protein
MESLFILIPLSLVLAAIIGAAFWWSVNSGQFDELDREGNRVLDDNDSASSTHTNQEPRPR